jgi:hypothetical protein
MCLYEDITAEIEDFDRILIIQSKFHNLHKLKDLRSLRVQHTHHHHLDHIKNRAIVINQRDNSKIDNAHDILKISL